MPRRAKPTPEQIRRDTSRLNAIKGAAMRDMKALQGMAKPKKRAKAPGRQGIRMG